MVSFSATCSALCNCTCSSPMKLLFLAHKMLFVWHTVLFYSHGGSLVSPNYWRSRLIFPFCCAFLQSKMYLGLYVLFHSRQVHCFHYGKEGTQSATLKGWNSYMEACISIFSFFFFMSSELTYSCISSGIPSKKKNLK